jgi:hypothetical protein
MRKRFYFNYCFGSVVVVIRSRIKALSIPEQKYLDAECMNVKEASK